MKVSATLSFLAFIVASPIAWAAEVGAAGNSATDNAFDFQSDIPAPASGVRLEDEDLSSPFAGAHAYEQTRYAQLLWGHYHGVGSPISEETYAHLPSAVDARGRPLWFDTGIADGFFNNLVLNLFQNEQFNDLERLFDDWSDPSALRADGRPMLSAYGNAFNTRLANPSDWEAVGQKIQKWRSDRPYSRAAAITEAIYWEQYAWNARGNGYAATVTDEGWSLFNERLEKAESALNESRSFASKSPLWRATLLEVGNGLNWPKPRLLQEFADGVAKDRTFLPFYTKTARFLSPKWGGDWRLVDEFVKQAVKDTQGDLSSSMYARIYMSVDTCNCGGFSLFRDTLANWADMKRSFEELVRLFPHSDWNFNKFAAYACIAGDKQTFLSLRFRLAKTIVPAAWPSNRSVDLCEHQFATDRS